MEDPRNEPPMKDLLLAFIAILKEEIFEFRAEFDESCSEFINLGLSKDKVIAMFKKHLEDYPLFKQYWVDSKTIILQLESFAKSKRKQDIDAARFHVKKCIKYFGLDYSNILNGEAFKFFIKAVTRINQDSDYFGKLFEIWLLIYF